MFWSYSPLLPLIPPKCTSNSHPYFFMCSLSLSRFSWCSLCPHNYEARNQNVVDLREQSSLKKTNSLSSRSHWLPANPQSRMGTHKSLSSISKLVDYLDLVLATTVALSFWAQKSCHFRRYCFPLMLIDLCLLQHLLLFLLQGFLSEWVVAQIYSIKHFFSLWSRP